jgi:hypothetical protein
MKLIVASFVGTGEFLTVMWYKNMANSRRSSIAFNKNIFLNPYPANVENMVSS